MSAPTFNMFKSTTVYGNFNNVDYPDNSVLASAYFQRNLTVSGDITCSGIINGIGGTKSDIFRPNFNIFILLFIFCKFFHIFIFFTHILFLFSKNMHIFTFFSY